MSKKIAIIMVIICAAMAAVVIQLRINTDQKAPEITFDDSEITYRDGMSYSELLEGVTAYDDEEGDVTDSLAVESVSPVDDKEAVVIYVAKDSKNNLVKQKRVIPYDYQEPDETEEEKTPGEEETVEEEGANIDNILPEDTQAVSEEGDAAVVPEPSPALSEEDAAKEEQEALADAMPAGSPRIYLTDYVVHVSVGTTVDRLSYVKDITDDADDIYDLYRKIQIEGDLNTAAAGTYECKYYVIDSNGNQSNAALLKFIVE